MNLRRVWAVARKEFLHVLRDPRSLGMAHRHPDADAAAVRLCADAGRGQRAAGRVGPERHARQPRLRQPLRRLALLLARAARRQLPRPGPRHRLGRGDDGPGDSPRFRPAARRRPRRPAAIASSTAATRTRPPSPLGYADAIAEIYAQDWSLQQMQRRGAADCRMFRWTSARASGSTKTWSRGTSSSPG